MTVDQTVDQFDKMKRLETLETAWRDCERCELSKGRKNVVHWRGSPDAPLCVIGASPSVEDDKQGRPVLWDVDREFDGALIKAGLEPSRDVFVINVVGCKTPGGRTPTVKEVTACRPRLEALLAIVEPRVLLLVGASWLLKCADTITRIQGHITAVEFEVENNVVDFPIVLTFRPSLYLGTDKSDTLQKQMVLDIQNAWLKR